MCWGDDSMAFSAASRDSNVTLIQCSPPANLEALDRSSAVRRRARMAAGSRMSFLKRR